MGTNTDRTTFPETLPGKKWWGGRGGACLPLRPSPTSMHSPAGHLGLKRRRSCGPGLSASGSLNPAPGPGLLRGHDQGAWRSPSGLRGVCQGKSWPRTSVIRATHNSGGLPVAASVSTVRGCKQRRFGNGEARWRARARPGAVPESCLVFPSQEKGSMGRSTPASASTRAS